MLDFIWVSYHPLSPVQSGPVCFERAEEACTRGSQIKMFHDTRTGRGCLLPSPSQSTSSHNTPPPWNPNGVWPGGPGSSHLEKKQSRNFSKICFCLLKTGIFSPLTLWLKAPFTCEFSFSQVSKQSVFPTAATLDSHCRCIHKRRPVDLLHMTTMKFLRPQMGKHFNIRSVRWPLKLSVGSSARAWAKNVDFDVSMQSKLKTVSRNLNIAFNPADCLFKLASIQCILCKAVFRLS